MKKTHFWNDRHRLEIPFLLASFFLFITPVFSQTNKTAFVRPPLELEDTLGSNQNGLMRAALYEIGKNNSHSFLQSYYGIHPQDGDALIGGILQLKNPHYSDSLSRICRSFSHIAGNFYTFQVTLSNVSLLAAHPGVAYSALARKAEPQIRKSLHDAGIDRAHLGIDLPMPYTGKGILTGLIDIGIEYTNPAFKTDNGDSLRILKAWAQKRKTGNMPANFNYGVEFVGQDMILAAQHDSLLGNHGTNVTGIMAGGSYGSKGKYTGVASQSKIIVVSSDRSENSLLDGMKYFQDELTARNKRGAFNLSWGSLIGPRDGTSLFDMAIDSLVGKGFLVVGAVGNWGRDTIHLRHVSSSVSSATTSMVQNYYSDAYTILDIWGKQNSSFSVQVKAINLTTGDTTWSSTFYPTTMQGEIDLTCVLGSDTSFIYLFNTAKDAANGKPNSFIAFLHDHEKTNHNLSITIRSKNNDVHAWASSGRFTNRLGNNQVMNGYSSGDNQYTVAELGGTSKSIITVGSHSTQAKFENIFGNDYYFTADSGRRGEFSGTGPTIDGRTKPDLTSGGTVIVPANRFEPAFWIGGSENYLIEDSSAFTDGTNTWYWVGGEYTSFAAPLVTGSVALLLEANPNLTFTQIRDVLRKNATQDAFTGTIPSTGSNLWGWGKLNLYGAISDVLSSVVTSVEEEQVNTAFWYTNPNTSSLVVFSTEMIEDNPTLELYDVLGNLVLKTAPISSQGYFYTYSLDPLPSGQYVGSLLENGRLKKMKVTRVD